MDCGFEFGPGAQQVHALLGDVGNDPLGSIRRGRSSHICDFVEDGPVGLMPHCRDHRSACGGHGTDQSFVGEGKEIFHAATAAGDDDDVDLRVLVEFGEVLHHSRHRVRSLDRTVADLEFRGRPAQVHISHNIFLRVGVTAGDEPDPIGQERQSQFAAGVEEPFRGQLLLQPLQTSEQLAEAHGADVVGAHRESTGLRPEIGFEVGDDMTALGQRSTGALEDVLPDLNGQGHFDIGVAQGEVAGLAAMVELDDLSFDPHARHAIDIGLHLRREQAQRPRVLRGGLGRGGRELLRLDGFAECAGSAGNSLRHGKSPSEPQA